MIWTDVWHKPFHYDHYGYIWDVDNVMTFSVDDLTEENDKWIQEFCENIVTVLNRKEPIKKYSGLCIKDGCDLYLNDLLIGSFRGWGHLTGGMHLDRYTAASVQDTLIEEVLSKISEDGVVIIKVQKTEE